MFELFAIRFVVRGREASYAEADTILNSWVMLARRIVAVSVATRTSCFGFFEI